MNATEEQRSEAVEYAEKLLKKRETTSMMLRSIWELALAYEVKKEGAAPETLDILRRLVGEALERVECFCRLCSDDCPKGLGGLGYVNVDARDLRAFAAVFDVLDGRTTEGSPTKTTGPVGLDLDLEIDG